MKKIASFILVILCINQVISQSDTIEEIEKGIWLEPVSPSFPGGKEKLFSFIELAKNYPDSAKANGIEGKVFLEFVVKKNGELSLFRILKTPDSSLGQEALRIVKLMPNWNPGRNFNGDSVDVKMVLPITFKINKEPIYNIVNIQPEFPDGKQKLFEYLSKNIKYSEYMFETGI